MIRQPRNPTGREPGDDVGDGGTSQFRYSSSSPILPTSKRTTADTEEEKKRPSEHNIEGGTDRWMARTVDERWETDSRLRMLEQKIEVLYYAVNKVQGDHDDLASIVTDVAHGIMSEAATVADSDTEASSLYFSSDSDTEDIERESGVRPNHGISQRVFNPDLHPNPNFSHLPESFGPATISELPDTAEPTRIEASAGQPGGYPVNDALYHFGRPTTPPIPPRSADRLNPLPPANPLPDTSGQRGTPPHHRFAFEFGRPRPLPILPIPYIPPPRPPPHGSRPVGPSLESSQPVTACAYFASPSEMPPFPPPEKEASQHDRRPWTDTYGSGYRMSHDARTLRHKRPSSGQVDGADDEYSSSSAAYVDRYPADGERDLHAPQYVGPGGFGTRDEVLDALRWDYMPGQGWIGGQSYAPEPMSAEAIDSFTAPRRQGAYFNACNRRQAKVNRRDYPAEGDFSSTTGEGSTASDSDEESDDSEKTIQPKRPQAAKPEPDESEVRSQKVLRQALRLAELDFSIPPPSSASQQPSHRRGHRDDTQPRPKAARRESQPQQPCAFLSSHDVLGLAAIVLLSPGDQEGFPRDFDPFVRYMQGAILWVLFLQQPAPNSQTLVWMTRGQIETHVLRFLRNYCNASDGALVDVDVPTCHQQARAIVSALLKRAEQSTSGQVRLLELWRSRRPRLRVLPRQARDPTGFRRELDRVRVNAPSLGSNVGSEYP